ncbi:transcription factor Clamp [Anabrus simplex]|uniref:transcription factor Clamp n=1 Tax=Anabrus simplex TaxID=316456 RepID=UPI0035A2F649
MALESNSWLAASSNAGNRHTSHRDQQQISGVVKSREDQLSQVSQHTQNFVSDGLVNRGQQYRLLEIPSSVGKCSMFTQTEHTSRFTQTEQPSGHFNDRSCLESGNDTVNCEGESTAVMFSPSNMQQQGNNAHNYSGRATKNEEEGKNTKPASGFSFSYNVNVLQKVHQQGAQGMSVGSFGSSEIAQPFSYNYMLVNQMSLAAAPTTAIYKCDVCGLVFTHLSLLNHHRRIHSAGNIVNGRTQSTGSNECQYTCDVCGANFALPGDLKTHKNEIHGKNNQNQQHSQVKNCNSCGVEIGCEHHGDAGGSGKRKNFVKCESCQEDYSAGEDNNPGGSGTEYSGGNTSGVEESESSLVSNSAGVSSTKPGYHAVKRRGVASVIQCPKCNGSGIIFIGGTRNNTNVNKPYRCNICDGTFSRYSSLWSHKRLHSGEKPFKCEICGLAFARGAYLRNHVRVHTGEKPFRCDICGMQFSQSPHLKNHERIHSGERPYQCEVCEKTFARHSTLWNHRRIHTGEKPYRCDICDSAFSQATHLNNHAKVHTGEKPHRCDICDVGFSDRFALKRHRGIHEKYNRLSSVSSVHTQDTEQAISDNTSNMNAGASSNTSGNSESNPQTGMNEMYECEVGGQIAFPGCSRPHEQKQ